jgi:hypothetical protein
VGETLDCMPGCCPCTAGILTSGVLPAVRHALDSLLVRTDPLVIPSSVSIMAAPVQLHLPTPCQGTAAALQRHR